MQTTLTNTADSGATTCPEHAFCIVDHDDPREEGDYHYGETAYTGPFSHGLDILAGGTPVVTIATDGEPQYLDADELDALIRALSGRRKALRRLTRKLGTCSRCGRPVTGAQSARIVKRWFHRTTVTHLRCAKAGAR